MPKFECELVKRALAEGSDSALTKVRKYVEQILLLILKEYLFDLDRYSFRVGKQLMKIF